MGASESARERFANERAAALEPRLAKVSIVVAERVPGLVVKRDGQVIPESSLGGPLPVDPGAHEISASAEGHEPWSNKFTVEPARSATVTVPPLRAVEVPVKPAPETPPGAVPPGTPPPVTEAEATPTLRYVGYGVGAAGVALVGVGLVFGSIANSKWSDAKDMCTGDSEPLSCTPEGVSLHDDAVSAARISTVSVIVGVAAIGGGVAMILLSPSSSRSSSAVSVRPSFDLHGGGLVVSGGF
jgi:hypothetical protein